MFNTLVNMFNQLLNAPDPQLGPVLYNAISDGNIDEVRRILESPRRPRLEDIRDLENPQNTNILIHVFLEDFENDTRRRTAPEVQVAIMKLLLNAYDSDISSFNKNIAFSCSIKAHDILKVLLDHCKSDITITSIMTLFYYASRKNSFETMEFLLNRENQLIPVHLGSGLLKVTSQATAQLVLDKYQDVISPHDKYETLKSAIMQMERKRADGNDFSLQFVINLLNDKEVMHEIIHTPNALHSLLEYFNGLNMDEELNTCIECFTKHYQIRSYLLENLEAFPNLEKAAVTAQMHCGRRIKSSAKVYFPSNPPQAEIEPSETKKEQPESDKKPKNQKRRHTIELSNVKQDKSESRNRRQSI